jgi:hypothetical protein
MCRLAKIGSHEDRGNLAALSAALVNELATHQSQRIYFGIAATDEHDADLVAASGGMSPHYRPAWLSAASLSWARDFSILLASMGLWRRSNRQRPPLRCFGGFALSPIRKLVSDEH